MSRGLAPAGPAVGAMNSCGAPGGTPRGRCWRGFSAITATAHDWAVRKQANGPWSLFPPLDDPPTPDLMKWMATYSPNPQNRFIEYKTGGHGADLFKPHPDVVSSVTDWYLVTLAGNKKSLPGELPGVSEGVAYWKMLDQADGA